MKEIFSKIKRFDNSIQFEDGKSFKLILKKQSNNRDYLFPPIERMQIGKSYKITVKKYMTEPSTSNFDFQDKWNDGKPMPLCIMQGEVIKETRGMYYMKLKADDITWTGFVIKSAIKEWEEI